MNAVNTGKFGPKAQKCVLLVYAYNRTAYLVQKLETRRIIETKNFKFNEKNLPGLEKKLRKKANWRLFSDGFRPNRKKVEWIQLQEQIELTEQAEEIRQTQETEQVVESSEFSSR